MAKPISLSAHFGRNIAKDSIEGFTAWTIPIRQFLDASDSTGVSNHDRYLVYVAKPVSGSLRSDAGDETTKLTDDLTMVYPTVSDSKRIRAFTLRLVDVIGGKMSTVRIPVEEGDDD